jgi:hypothetical protein
MPVSFRHPPFAVVRQRLGTPRQICRASANGHRKACIAAHRLRILAPGLPFTIPKTKSNSAPK